MTKTNTVAFEFNLTAASLLEMGHDQAYADRVAESLPLRVRIVAKDIRPGLRSGCNDHIEATWLARNDFGEPYWASFGFFGGLEAGDVVAAFMRHLSRTLSPRTSERRTQNGAVIYDLGTL